MSGENFAEVVLGEHLSRLEFGAADKARIAGLIESKNEQLLNILNAFIPKTEPFKAFAKRVKIPGYSKGRPQFEVKAIEMLLQAICDDQAEHKAIAWAAYRYAIINFLNADKDPDQGLYALLIKTKIENNNLTGETLLSTICSFANQFKVSRATVTALYEFWPIPRVSDFKKFSDSLSESFLEEPNQPEAVEEENNEDTNELVSRIEKQLEKQVSVVLKEIKSLSRRLEDIETLIKAQDEALTNSNNTTDSIRSSVTNLSRKMESLSSQFKQLPDPIDSNGLRKEVIQDTKQRIKELHERVIKEVKDTFDSQIFETKSHLQQQIHQLARGNVSDGIRKISPIDPVPFKEPVPFKITSELQFIQSWQQVLTESFSINISLEQLSIFYSIIASSPFVVLEDKYLFESWLQTTGWGPFAMQLAASPTWTEETDWHDGVAHLAAPDSSGTPRVVAIHGFDNGLMDCYLTPTLRRLQIASMGITKKVFLLSTGANTLTHQVSSMCPVISLEDLEDREQVPFRAEVAFTPTRKHYYGLKPAMFRKWAEELEPERDFNFSALNRFLDKPLPKDIEVAALKTTGWLKRFYSPIDSIIIAAHYYISPWITQTSGASAASNYIQAMKEILL